MKKLKIAEHFSLPLETVTQTIVVYGGRGMGKTNLGSVLAEELHRARLKFSVIDPMGVWWGLQHGATRGMPGIEVLVLGGLRGDIPIEPTAGAVVADLVVDEEVSTVVDISRHSTGKMWSKGEKIKFVADYCTRLYERQGEKKSPILQMIDEAARYCPQMIPHGSPDVARCAGAVEMLVEEGRNIGIGMVTITQRSARLNKSVAELSEVMIAFRTVGPNSIKAVMDWLGEHIEKARHREFLTQLRSLPVGSALLISPGWLQHEGVVHFRARETFDSSATPKHGKALRAPGKARKPNLEKYKTMMAETIEKAKQNNPTALRAEVKKLRAQVEIVKRTEAVKANTPKIVEVPIMKASDYERLEKIVARAEKAGNLIGEAVGGVLTTIQKRLPVVCHTPVGNVLTPRPFLSPAVETGTKLMRRAITDLNHKLARESKVIKTTPGAAPDGALGKGEKTILIVIAQAGGGVTKVQMTVMTGYKRSSRDTYLQKLGQRQYVECMGNVWTATQAGIDALGNDYQPLPTGEALRDFWITKLGKGEAAILQLLISDYPKPMGRENLSEITGYARSSRDTYLQKLGARKLIESVNGGVKASDILF